MNNSKLSAIVSFIMILLTTQLLSAESFRVGDYEYTTDYWHPTPYGGRGVSVCDYYGFDEDLVVPDYVTFNGKVYPVTSVDLDGYHYSGHADLKSILLSSTTKEIVLDGDSDFSWSGISVLYIPENVTFVSVAMSTNPDRICLIGASVKQIDRLFLNSYDYEKIKDLYVYPKTPPDPSGEEALNYGIPKNLFLPGESIEKYLQTTGWWTGDGWRYTPNWDWVMERSDNVSALPPRVFIPAYTEKKMVCGKKYPLWWKMLDENGYEVKPHSVSVTPSDPGILYEDGYIWCETPVQGTITITAEDAGYVCTREIKISTDDSIAWIGDYIYSCDKETRTATITNYTGSETDIELPSTFEYLGEEYTVTGIGERAIARPFIKSVKIAPTITRIDGNAFDTSQISVLELPSSVQSIAQSVLAAPELRIVVLDENLNQITGRTDKLHAIDMIYCLSATPPAVSYKYPADKVNYFFVPSESESLYKSSAEWKDVMTKYEPMPQGIIVPTYACMECLPGKSYRNSFKLINTHGEEMEIATTTWMVTQPGLQASAEGDVISYTSGEGNITLMATDMSGNIYFRNIYLSEGDPSGVEEVNIGIDTDMPEEIYTLQGLRVDKEQDQLTPGIYIIRKGNRAKKIMVR